MLLLSYHEAFRKLTGTCNSADFYCVTGESAIGKLSELGGLI